MIRRFDRETALLLIDVQVGVNSLEHWGGKNAQRNNPAAEERIGELLDRWRSTDKTVLYTRHDSREPRSPLKVSLSTGAFIPGLGPRAGEAVVVKDVNGGFIGTNLELHLRRRNVTRIVVAGFFTNMCVETTIRQGGNMGYEIYIADDACATTNRMGFDGVNYDAETVHALSVANMHREFCTALKTRDLVSLLDADAGHVSRAMGNRSLEEIAMDG